MSQAANIPRLYAFSFLKMALFPMAIITLFWKDQIGLSITEILLLQGIFSVATLLMEYPSGYISDRLGYRASLSLASLIGLLGWALYTRAASFNGVMAAEILLGISFAFISGSDTALLFETLKSLGREEEYASYDGRMVFCAQVGEACGALFAGWMYAQLPLLPFLVQILVWVLALGLSWSLKETPSVLAAPPQSHLLEAMRICRYALVDNPRLRQAILYSTFVGVASFYPVWLIQPFMQQCSVPLTWFGPVWAGANLCVALFSLLSVRFHALLGWSGMLSLFFVLIAAGFLGLGLTGSVLSFLFYYLLTAMRGLQGPLFRTVLQRESRRENRASILSLKSLVFRLLFVLSGPLVGLAADSWGLQTAFLVLAGAFILTLPPLSLLFFRTTRSSP